MRTLADGLMHPGGEALTRELGEVMALEAGARVLDLGAGAGTSAMLLARSRGWHTLGLDHGVPAGDCDRPWLRADLRRLPLADGRLDGALSECVLSLFEQPGGVLGEWRRVLRPGGVLGISDMTRGDGLPDELGARLAPWTCLVNARSLQDWKAQFEASGFEVAWMRDASDGVLELLARLKRRLLMAASGALWPGAKRLPFDVDEVRRGLAEAESAVRAGHIGYFAAVLRAT
ncbi:MAG: methyltransferase domain-containing protein [Xanthomonadales bacterium]|nr:methyltransferase domain-containing protein [Xanthomonadales bacterium]